jgi:transcriptional regulator with XRE-family HTH domain
MSIYGESDHALLRTLGQRLRRARLRRNLSQEQLAERAGINRTTVSEYERGASTSTMTLVQVLRALEMLEELDGFLPEPGPSPLDLARRQGRQRQRATGTRGHQPDEDPREDPSW